MAMEMISIHFLGYLNFTVDANVFAILGESYYL